MTDVRFLSREIGSLAKPPWLVKARRGVPLEEADVEHARAWGERLDVEDHGSLVEQLTAKGEIGEAELTTWAALYALRLLEHAGLDVVYDGEQRRTEMYDHVAAHAKGFEPRGTVRSFDNKYYAKAAVVEAPRVEEPYDGEEYRFVSEHTDRRVKVPFTGPYTVVDWSYDEHYGHRTSLGATHEERRDARRSFLLDVAEHVVRPNAAAVVEAGCDWIQIDEPALTTRLDEVPLGVEAYNKAVDGLDVRSSLHVCFSDYRLLWPHVLELENCLELQLEFANRDSRVLGTGGAARPGYEPLFLFQEGGPAVGLGVVDVHTDFVEPAELVRDRILYAAAVLGPARIAGVNPDCGLRTRSWDVAFEKLRKMVEGTRLAETELNAR